MDPRPPAEGVPGTPPSAGPPPAGQQPGQPSPHQGQPYGGPPHGQPQHGQPYSQPQQQPPYGAPYQGQPQHGQPQHGQPQHGQPFGTPAYQGLPQYPGMRPVQGMPGSPHSGPPQQTSVPAVLAFVFSFVGGILLSIILAIVALNRIPVRNQKGKGLAIAALAISGVWIVGLVVVAVLSDGGEPDRNASGQVTATQNTRPDKLRVGDCVAEINEGEVLNIKVQPCDQPNGGRVYAVFDLPAGEWPGLTAVQAAAEKGCTDRWKASKEQADAESSIFYLHPTEDGWSLGDRGATCLLTPK